MDEASEKITILVADDDPDDCILIKEAFQEAGLNTEMRFVEDGEALMDYLFHQGQYRDASQFPLPDLILLDLNMPRKDGREALKEIKRDPVLQSIPVVILSTSNQEEDIHQSYEQGANSFISKPVTFNGLVKAMKSLGDYWFGTVELPPDKK